MGLGIGYLCKLQVDDGSSNAFVDVADVVGIDPPTAECSDVNVNTLGMATLYEQTVPGLIKGGMIGLDCFWSAASYSRLIALLRVTGHNFKLVMNDGASTPTKYTWSGYIKKVGIEKIEDDKVPPMKVEITVLSAVTVTAST